MMGKFGLATLALALTGLAGCIVAPAPPPTAYSYYAPGPSYAYPPVAVGVGVGGCWGCGWHHWR